MQVLEALSSLILVSFLCNFLCWCVKIGLPPGIVFEATLDPDGESWFVSRTQIRLKPDTKTFAPANLRCTVEDPAYKALVQFYIDNKSAAKHARKDSEADGSGAEKWKRAVIWNEVRLTPCCC